MSVLDYYKTFRLNNYVFPFLDINKHTSAISIDNRLRKTKRQVNEDLKELATLAKIETNLTTYVARHTFATVLKRSGVSTSLISEMMGHDSEAITQVYLDSFENKQIYEAALNLL
ncbi:tyrosine-type recombinase/integrase [Emticicia sp. 17c]|uniref:tyrosine-type recombinase/integrase n=1 Tax=Emticicia sp. 17c TaxID=3127704 RepID=UPI00301BD1BC